MKGVNIPRAKVALSRKEHGTGKLAFTWEMIFVAGGWVGINTLAPNRIIREAFEQKLIPGFRQYSAFKPEAWISPDTRIDFAMGAARNHWVEVKNVSWVEKGVARFPDSITTRGQKHLIHLTRHAQRGGKSTMLYVVQHHGAEIFEPADDIDPAYGELLRKAVRAGVKIQVWKARVSIRGIELDKKIRYRLP